MSTSILHRPPLTMTSVFTAELVNKYSKDIKSVRNRIVQVEFRWFQASPCQCYRLRIHEDQFLQAQQHIRSKKLMQMTFEEFVVLIDPIFANEAAEVSMSVLRSSFDNLFDQNSNGKIEREEFESLFVLLHGWMGKKKYLSDENLRQTLSHRLNHVSFQEFSTYVKSGYLRELLMS